MDRELEYLEKSINTSVKDVIETMTGLVVEEVKSETNSFFEGEITAAMIIKGEKDAFMSLIMSRELVSTIVCYMTGTDESEISDEELYDGAAELVNMIAGRTKALLNGSKFHFEITAPFTIVGNKHFIVCKNKVLKVCKRYIVDEKELNLQIHYTC